MIIKYIKNNFIINSMIKIIIFIVIIYMMLGSKGPQQTYC